MEAQLTPRLPHSAFYWSATANPRQSQHQCEGKNQTLYWDLSADMLFPGSPGVVCCSRLASMETAKPRISVGQFGASDISTL
jgi:hypothetical protein